MTSKALYSLGTEYNVDLPIVEAVYSILFENTAPIDALNKLFVRTVKKEF